MGSRGLVRLLAVGSVTGLVVVALPTAAQAATYSGNGLRCTIVGTSHADHLVGTSHRDVICGLGGNDTISSGAGDDVVDAGTGADVVDGGTGQDLLFGGSGDDRIRGADGNDEVHSGSGNDKVYGSGGSDRLYASSGNDVVEGGDGADRLDGGDGDDVVRGGGSGDVLMGSAGRDTLYGETGDDDLRGGDDADHLDGGIGTNWCTISAEDVRYRCKYDKTPPKTDAMKIAGTVDVTDGPVTVPYKVHVTDDTGAEGVIVLSMSSARGARSVFLPQSVPSLTSGTVRDGWWSGTLTVPRWTEERTFDFYVDAQDRVHHSVQDHVAAQLAVVDRHADTARPQVVALTASTTSVDVRTAAASFPVAVHATDDLSGVAKVLVCSQRRTADFWTWDGECSSLTLSLGTRLNGLWKGRVYVPKGTVAGLRNLEVVVEDRGHPDASVSYLGPEEYVDMVNRSDHPLPLPGGTGRFTVVGASDTHLPVLKTVRLTPSRVDTLGHDVLVSYDFRATDVEGVSLVTASIAPDDSASSPFYYSQADQPSSGTRKDGVWHIDFLLPQGTPPGVYKLWVAVSDVASGVSYASPGNPQLGYSPELKELTAAQTPYGPVDVTVVDNPAG